MALRDEEAARHEPERLLLVVADHLHEHCTCAAGARGDARCAACAVRDELRGVRERMLWWHAEGRRLREQRDEAIANAATHVARNAELCGRCQGLGAIAAAMRRGEADP